MSGGPRTGLARSRIRPSWPQSGDRHAPLHPGLLHITGYASCSPGCSGCHRLSIIASDLRRSGCPLRTACLQYAVWRSLHVVRCGSACSFARWTSSCDAPYRYSLAPQLLHGQVIFSNSGGSLPPRVRDSGSDRRHGDTYVSGYQAHVAGVAAHDSDLVSGCRSDDRADVRIGN